MKSIFSVKAALIAASALAWVVPVQSSALPLSVNGAAVEGSLAQSNVIKVGGKHHRHHGSHHNRHHGSHHDRHHRRHRGRDIAAGFVDGAIVGGAIANHNNRYNDGYYEDAYYDDSSVWARRRTARSYAQRCECRVYSGDMDVRFYGRGTPGYHRHDRGGYYMHTHSGYLHGHHYQNR